MWVMAGGEWVVIAGSRRARAPVQRWAGAWFQHETKFDGPAGSGLSSAVRHRPLRAPNKCSHRGLQPTPEVTPNATDAR